MYTSHMPRVSKKNIDKDIQDDLGNHFLFLISELQSTKDIKMFLNDFLSDEEKGMLTKRLALHMMLEMGYKMRDIAIVLGVSRETIRMHTHVWSKGGPEYKAVIRRIVKSEKTKKFWEKVENFLKYII